MKRLHGPGDWYPININITDAIPTALPIAQPSPLNACACMGCPFSICHCGRNCQCACDKQIATIGILKKCSSLLPKTYTRDDVKTLIGMLE